LMGAVGVLVGASVGEVGALVGAPVHTPAQPLSPLPVVSVL
jgi:hypothetical protein